MKARVWLVALGLVVGWAAGVWGEQRPVRVSMAPLPDCLHPGQAVELVVELVIAPGVKIAGPRPTGGGLPTALHASAYSRWVRLGPARMPTARSGYYKGQVRFTLPLEVDRGAPPGVHEVAVSLEYQACEGEVCMLPQVWERLVKLHVCPGYWRATNQKQPSSATSGRASSR